MSISPQDRSPVRPDQERTWAMASHIGTLVSAWIALGLICPLVIWLLYRERSDYIRRHSLESLNFQITLLIYLAISVVLGLITFGLLLFVLLPALGIFALVVIVMATIAAGSGQDYRYPLTFRMVH
ncbi:MAG: DUF4870 domain-containing protein [Kribbellaceae bacterium]|nr:DUF4870 domain-containing protein [Kribbellaceae bacterium]